MSQEIQFLIFIIAAAFVIFFIIALTIKAAERLIDNTTSFEFSLLNFKYKGRADGEGEN